MIRPASRSGSWHRCEQVHGDATRRRSAPASTVGRPPGIERWFPWVDSDDAELFEVGGLRLIEANRSGFGGVHPPKPTSTMYLDDSAGYADVEQLVGFGGHWSGVSHPHHAARQWHHVVADRFEHRGEQTVLLEQNPPRRRSIILCCNACGARSATGIPTYGSRPSNEMART